MLLSTGSTKAVNRPLFNDPQCSQLVSNQTELESKLLEEPAILARLVSLLKLALDLSPCFPAQGRVSERILVDQSLIQHHVYRIPGRHEVIVVDDLDKGFDLGPDLDFILPMRLVTGRGCRSTPATSACPYCLSVVPSS